MRPSLPLAFVFCCLGAAVYAQDIGTRAQQLEARGDSMAALDALRDAVKEQPENIGYLTQYAEFLDRRGDPKARDAYSKLLAKVNGDQRRKADLARRLVILDLIAGDNQAASRHLEEYRGAGGTDLGSAPIPARRDIATPGFEHYIEIPGPLPSFARMAAISRELEPEGVLPAIARNVVTNGYQASASYEGLSPPNT